MAKNKGNNAPPADPTPDPEQTTDIPVDEPKTDVPQADPAVDEQDPPADPTPDEDLSDIMPVDSANYVLDESIADSDSLPHAAFKEAAAKYYPCECVIIAYTVTDTYTCVVLDAGTQGRRKEKIGA
jgi:hypothetical protein